MMYLAGQGLTDAEKTWSGFLSDMRGFGRRMGRCGELNPARGMAGC